jgi:hypothetical protein
VFVCLEAIGRQTLSVYPENSADKGGSPGACVRGPDSASAISQLLPPVCLKKLQKSRIHTR